MFIYVELMDGKIKIVKLSFFLYDSVARNLRTRKGF